jgi:pilus assembly protein TadC
MDMGWLNCIKTHWKPYRLFRLYLVVLVYPLCFVPNLCRFDSPLAVFVFGSASIFSSSLHPFQGKTLFLLFLFASVSLSIQYLFLIYFFSFLIFVFSLFFIFYFFRTLKLNSDELGVTKTLKLIFMCLCLYYVTWNC